VVADAVVADTGCTQEAATEGATQVGRCLLGRANR